ncbi:MAG TPA: hypothetical protein VL362_01360 [Patescibacteria group bacterium]|jgi:hypothetical protein|nr:hypothetical protein [Patescibacteria group bacterium]
MTLLFMDGFDAGDFPVKWTSYGGGTQVSTTTRFGTGYSMNISNYFWSMKKIFPFQTNHIYVGWAMYTAAGGSYGSDTYMSLFGNDGTTLHLRLMLNTPTTLCVKRGDGTTLATSTNGTFPTSTWNYIEMSATIDDTAGTVVVRVNGATVINFTGDTRNGGATTTIDSICLGDVGGNVGPRVTTYFDDLYVLDDTGAAPYNTFLGDVRVRTLTPNAAGSSTQFTPSTGANYTTVDEIPYSASDYVSSPNVGDRDTYSVSDLSGTASIYGIQNNVIAKKTDAGSVSLKPAIKSGATVYYGTPSVLTATDITYYDTRQVDPSTSANWTTTGVNSLESGFEVA